MKRKTITGYLLSGFCVIALAAAMVFGVNAAMQAYMDDEVARIRASAFRAEQIRQAAEAGENLALQNEVMRLKLEQMEQFYQQNKYRTEYHYYGQYYELFEQVYAADTLIIGTSHAAHGVHPLYLDEAFADRNFFNFALNGATPSYYLKWYDILKKEAEYPLPKTVIWCVDWFMCDSGWLWRRISYDEPADGALGMMRAIHAGDAPGEQIRQEEGDSPSVTLPAAEKTLWEKVKEADPKNLDDLMTVLMTNIPVFSSRDRLPEMAAWLFSEKEPVPSPLTDEELAEISSGYAGDTQLPVYEHEEIPGNSFRTHKYYKGYIPYEVPYGGEQGTVGCSFHPEEWDAFLALLEDFREDGVQVILVQVPEYSGAASADRITYNGKIAQIAQQYDLSFLNYNDQLLSPINDDALNFSDWGHLNENGSIAFSKKLAEDLAPLLNK